jgi:general secretion pathway protein H
MRRSTEHGFTLIELLVVIIIIGLISGAVMLNMADPRGRLSDDAQRFAGRVRAAHDRAIVTARPVALWVAPGGYGFEEHRDGHWDAIREKPFLKTNWAKDTQASVEQGGKGRIWFDTIGRADQPMRFVLARDDRRIGVQIDLDGRVKIGE